MENIQKIRKQYTSPLSVARVYYSVISAINGIVLTNKELEFISYLSVQKEEFTKDGFISEYRSSENSVNNILHSLRNKGILLKDRGVISIHPMLNKLDFTNPFILNIHIGYEAN